MSSILNGLADENRVLFTVKLTPVQGSRFQPTGFPDLGAATYQAGESSCLLVESAQSMANRMETACWDETQEKPVQALEGISFIRVEQDGKYLTSSMTEAHRLNSPYILESKDKTFMDTLKSDLECLATGPINRSLFTKTVLKYDANSLLHGLFLAKKELAGGRLRISRALSAFIEAESIQVAASGGVKNDHVDPQGETAKGFGNVPFHREEYTAGSINAYFNIDLNQIRGYGLGKEAEDMLTLLALYKIRALLGGNLRLRTACDLEVVEESITATRPSSFKLPELAEITPALASAISACKDSMSVTTVNYTK
jgi:CRISPR-associated protein Csb1